MKIVFIDNTEIEYNSRDRHNSKLRGSEAVVINMAESLANLNHQTCAKSFQRVVYAGDKNSCRIDQPFCKPSAAKLTLPNPL